MDNGRLVGVASSACCAFLLDLRSGAISLGAPQLSPLWKCSGILQRSVFSAGYLCAPTRDHRFPLSDGRKFASIGALFSGGPEAYHRRLAAGTGRAWIDFLRAGWAAAPPQVRIAGVSSPPTVLLTIYGSRSGAALCTHTVPAHLLQSALRDRDAVCSSHSLFISDFAAF